MAQSIFTPGPSVYNVQAESPVAAVDPGYGAIGQGLSNLGTGVANYMKLSGSGSGGKTGPSRKEVAEWGEGIQRIAGLPESQQALEYKKLVGTFGGRGVNVGNQAFTSITENFLGTNPQFTVGEQFQNVQEKAMRESPEFKGIFAQISLASPELPDDQKYQIAEQQFMANQARTASLEQAATFTKQAWKAPDGGEAKVLAQAMAVRDYGLFDAVEKFEEGGLPASLNALDNYVARLNAERTKYTGLARQGGLDTEDVKNYNDQIDRYIKEVENLKTTLNNDNVTPALKKVLSEALGGNVDGLNTIADVVARLSVLESGKLNPDLQIRVMEAVGAFGGKIPTDPKELETVLGNGVSRQILESVTDTLGSRVEERPSVLDRFDLGFGTRPTPVEGSVDGQPPAQVTTSVPGTSVVTIEDLANSTDPVVKDLATKYVNMPPSQLSTQAKTAEIFLLAPPTGPMTKDQSEIFADKAIAFSLGSQSKDKDQPYSARFVNRFWNSPNFLANMENLKTANPSLYGQVKSVLAGHLEKEINVNSKRTETAARKITEKAPWVSYDLDTGRLKINPSFYTRDARGNIIPNRSAFEEIPPSEKLAFLKDLTENYGGDIQAAALDSYQKLDILKFQFLKVPGYKDVKEFIDRANSTKAVAQVEANLNKDELKAVKLAPETYIRQRANRGTAVSWIGQGEEVSSLMFRGRPLSEAKKRNIDQASDALSSIGQAVEDAFTFEGSGRTVTDPETGIVYNQGQTMGQGIDTSPRPTNQRPDITLTPTNRMTSAGRRLYETSEGELVSEKTTTVQDPNSKLWYNIPTINNGTMMSVDEAAELYLGKGEVKDVETGRVIQSFETIEEAEDAARARSQELRQGQTMDQAPPPPIVQPAGATSGISSVTEAGAGFTTVTKADGTVVKREGLRSWRNNNPGNLEAGDFATSKGAIGSDGRFAVFKTYEEGREAMRSLLFEGKNYRTKTISEAITRYAPPKENDTALYIKRVTDALGVSDSTKLSDLSNDQRSTMLDAMQKHEGFKEGTETVVEPSSGPDLVSRAGTAIGQALSSPAQAAPLPDSMLPPGFRSTDSQGRPFLRPEEGAEVTQGSMLDSLISSVRSALNLGSDEEARSTAEKLMQSGIIPRRPEGLPGDRPMRLPPVRPTEQELAEANQLTPSEQRIADSREKVEARRVFNVALNKAASEEATPTFVESTITGLSEAIGLGVMGEAFINDIVSKQLPFLNSWRKTTLTEENLDPDELSVMQKLYKKVGLGKVNYADYGADASIGLKGKNRNKSNLLEIMGYGAKDRTQKTFGEGTFVKEGKDIFFVDQYDHNFYTVFNEGEKLRLISPEEYEKSGRSVREDLLNNYKAYSEDKITMFQLMHNVGFLLGSRDYESKQKDSGKKIKIKVN